jgi:hypothetical protein
MSRPSFPVTTQIPTETHKRPTVQFDEYAANYKELVDKSSGVSVEALAAEKARLINRPLLWLARPAVAKAPIKGRLRQSADREGVCSDAKGGAAGRDFQRRVVVRADRGVDRADNAMHGHDERISARASG